jgi:hypothetical protein
VVGAKSVDPRTGHLCEGVDEPRVVVEFGKHVDGARFSIRDNSAATASAADRVAALEYCGNSGRTIQRSTPADRIAATAERMLGSPYRMAMVTAYSSPSSRATPTHSSSLMTRSGEPASVQTFA